MSCIMVVEELRRTRRMAICALARMACAVISQTARDLVSGRTVGKAGDAVWLQQRRAERSANLESALNWIEERGERWPFSLDACCTLINDWLDMKGRDLDRDYRQLQPDMLRQILRTEPERLTRAIEAEPAETWEAEDSFSEFHDLSAAIVQQVGLSDTFLDIIDGLEIYAYPTQPKKQKAQRPC